MNNNKEQKDYKELEKLYDLFEAGAFDTVLKEAVKFVDSEFFEISTGALRIIALSYLRQKMFKEAVPFFEKAAALSEDSNDYFDIVISATLSGDIEKGKAAFEQAIKRELEKAPEEMPATPFLRFYYACSLRDIGEFQLAFEQIEKLRPVYEHLQITDTHYVFTSGAPYFSDVMDVAFDVFKAFGKDFDAEAWLTDLSKYLDSEGQAYISDIKKMLLG